MRKFIPILISILATTALAIPQAISNPKQIGSSNFRFLGTKIYSAKLYTENGAPYHPNEAFILELKYDRNFSKSQIIKASLDEMSRLGRPRPDIKNALEQCIRNVATGDRFAAVNKSSNRIDFYLNDQKTCTINARGISADFFAIWLSNNSRDPNGSRALKGQ